MSLQPAFRLASETPAAVAARSRFYIGMAVVAILVVLVGFGPLLVNPAGRTSPMTPLTVTHSVVFGAWLALFLGQTLLVGRGRLATHRRVGLAAMTLAIAMIVVGYTTAIATGRRGFDLSGDLNVAQDPLGYLVFPLGDLLSFAVFAAAAFWYRRTPAIHKRLMVFATAGSLMGAPLAHFIGHTPALRDIPAPIILVPLTALYFANAIHDRLILGRIHRLSLWGGVALFVWANLRAAVIGPSAVWHRLAGWLVS